MKFFLLTLLTGGCMYDVNAVPRPMGIAEDGGTDIAGADLPYPDLTEPTEAGPEPPDALTEPTEAPGADLGSELAMDAGADLGSETSSEVTTETVEGGGEASTEVVDASPEAAGPPCGGPTDVKCATSYYCDLPAGMCGVAKLWGVCVPIPGSLGTCADMVRADVCNCDGTTVRNDCIRILLGRQKKHDGPC